MSVLGSRIMSSFTVIKRYSVEQKFVLEANQLKCSLSVQM